MAVLLTLVYIEFINDVGEGEEFRVDNSSCIQG